MHNNNTTFVVSLRTDCDSTTRQMSQVIREKRKLEVTTSLSQTPSEAMTMTMIYFSFPS